jgi:hypothetical protein
MFYIPKIILPTETPLLSRNIISNWKLFPTISSRVKFAQEGDIIPFISAHNMLP